MKTLSVKSLNQLALKWWYFTIDELVESTSNQTNSKPKLVVTANLSHWRGITRDSKISSAYDQAQIVCADGQPLLWATRLNRGRVPPRIAGVDIVEKIIRAKIKVFIVGSSEMAITAAFANLRPDAVRHLDYSFISGRIHLQNNREAIEQIIEELEAFKPLAVLIALGFPKQEQLYAQLVISEDLYPSVYFGIGGSFEILGGYVSRAPKFVQKIALEWVWRLAQEPLRLFLRYFNDGLFFIRAIIQIIYARFMGIITK